MATVLVTGGTGVLGAHMTRLLGERGHEVRVLSRRAGAGTHRGDLATGAGLAEAAAGATLIAHAASDTRRRGRGDVEQARNLLAAAGDARHLLYVSIVGVDAIPYAYYERKLACEHEIARSGVPHTILRATQFHELLAFVIGRIERWPIAPLPLDWRVQSVAAAEAAARAVELLDGKPLGRAPDFGGPEVLSGRQVIDAWRQARGRPRRVVNLRLAGRVSRGFREGRNTCPDHAQGSQPWSEFVSGST